MSKIFTLSLPLAISIACGKPAQGEKIQYEVVPLNCADWTDAQFAQWLAAGLANIGGDKLAGAATASGGMSGQGLIDYKRKMARDWVSSLSASDAFPGRKPGEGKTAKPGAKKIMTLAQCREMLETTVSPDDLGMDAAQFAAWLDGASNKMRAKKIQDAGRDPATYDAEEAAKLSPVTVAGNASDDNASTGNGGAE